MNESAARDKTKPFVCSYFHDHSQWSLTIDAYDWDDAEARCRKLGLKLDGELVATVPLRLGLFARIACAVRNWLQPAAY